MSRHINGQSITKTTLFPEVIDDFFTEDNPIRVIDLFVDQQIVAFSVNVANGL